MSDLIQLKKGPKVNRPNLLPSELTCDNDVNDERLIYGGLGGNVVFPNFNDVVMQQMLPQNFAANFNNITVGNIILSRIPIKLGTVILG